MKRILLLISMLFILVQACEPFEDAKPEIGPQPTAEQLNFTITPTNDPYRFKITNTSSITGIAHWDLGNGRILKGDEVIAYYPLPDTYTLKLTLYTSGGTADMEKQHTTTETDYALFEDPFFIAVSGGVDALQGKTWVIDSTAQAHLGVGPGDANSPIWWAASPLAKTGRFLYDDEFTFTLVGFKYEINTKGRTHASHLAAAAGRTGGYYGDPVFQDEFDQDVVVLDQNRGNMTWMAEKTDGKYFISFTPASAVLAYDAGGERTYEVLEWNQNFLHVKNIDAEGNARFHKLIPKGFANPQVTFNLNVTPGAAVNEFEVKLADLVIPTGKTITSVSFDFGDGSAPVSVSNATQTVSHTYIRKGNYQVVATAQTTDGAKTAVANAIVANHHPDYEPYLLNMMVLYNDFADTQLRPVLFDNAGGGGQIEILANPNSSRYPNRSAMVGKMTKVNAEWANAFMQLPAGYRFNLNQYHKFSVKVYGKAGDKVLLKLENTDRGGNAWQTGTADLFYTIKQDNTWEIAEFDFAGISAGFDWTGDIFTGDVTTDPRFNQDFYNVVRIMVNPGVGSGTHVLFIDDLSGPHIEGLK